MNRESLDGLSIPAPSVELTTGPVTFPSPVFTASGCFGYGLEVADLTDSRLLGGVVSKTLTMKPRSGNPQPRLRELPTGLLNSIGLENIGLEAFLELKLPVLRKKGIRCVLSLAAAEEEEFPEMISLAAAHEGWLGIELNLSCPNVARGGMDFGKDPAQILRICRMAKEALPADRALWVKLTPNTASISELALAAEEGGAHAVSCINTVVGMVVDLQQRRPVLPRGFGGYSGPGILPIALAKAWEVARAVRIPILGIGGISSLEDALAFFVVGCSGIQIGSALFAEPDIAERIALAIPPALAERGFSSLDDFRADELKR